MSFRKEVLSMIPDEIPNGIIELSRQECFEQVGLRELCSNTDFMSVKRGGREPGRHEWGR